MLANNTIFDFKRFGINVLASRNVTITRNLVASINSRNLIVLDEAIDISAGIIGCAE